MRDFINSVYCVEFVAFCLVTLTHMYPVQCTSDQVMCLIFSRRMLITHGYMSYRLIYHVIDNVLMFVFQFLYVFYLLPRLNNYAYLHIVRLVSMFSSKMFIVCFCFDRFCDSIACHDPTFNASVCLPTCTPVICTSCTPNTHFLVLMICTL